MLAGDDDWLRQLVTETGEGDDELKLIAWRQWTWRRGQDDMK